MYLAELTVWNFRKYGCSDMDAVTGKLKPGLQLKLNPGLNLIVGENDSGKTAIIDSIKLVLGTQSNDFLKVEYEDFHLPVGSPEAARADYLEIGCDFQDLKPNEAKNFIEWLSIRKIDGINRYCLKVTLRAIRRGRRVSYEVKAGTDAEGSQMDSEARSLLRATYLKPLRDAENEMAPRRNSRLSQILDSHKAFEDKEEHHLKTAMAQANEMIEQYFNGHDGGRDLDDQSGKILLDTINSYLREFSPVSAPLTSKFFASEMRLRTILEKLSLQLSDSKYGLGSHNLLFIAVELLLLNREDYTGLRIALVEEIEAHIHPQAQLRLIEYLQREAAELGIQLLLTTHSTVLASKVSLDNLIICSNGKCYPMDYNSTKLLKGDYAFLERFLDSTKANLFFAKGVILVEGDAENLLLPTLAEIIGRPISRYGSTVVNVGSTAFLRYSKIFQRKDESSESMDIPVSVITDNDVKPDLYKTIDPNARTRSDYKGEDTRQSKIDRYSGQTVKAFVSPLWTLEYDIAAGGLTREIYRAVLYARKIQNSEGIGLTDEKREQCDREVNDNMDMWEREGRPREEIAFEVYQGIMQKQSAPVSKAIVAQCLAKILQDTEDKEQLKERIMGDHNLKYIVDAIFYATGGTRDGDRT